MRLVRLEAVLILRLSNYNLLKYQRFYFMHFKNNLKHQKKFFFFYENKIEYTNLYIYYKYYDLYIYTHTYTKYLCREFPPTLRKNIITNKNSFKKYFLIHLNVKFFK